MNTRESSDNLDPASPSSLGKDLPVLVSGGTSHTGERVVAFLLERGVRVRLLTRNPEKPGDLGIPVDRIEIVKGDLSSPWTVWDALEGCRAMINVAHIRFGPTCATACEGVGVRRLVVFSSTRLYTRWPCETSRAVARGESSVATSPLDWTILRSSMIYGGTRDNNITRLVKWVEKHRWFPLLAGGRSLIQPVFVDDLAELAVRVLDDSRTHRRALLVAGPHPISYRQLMEQIAEETHRRLWFVPVPSSLAILAATGLQKIKPSMRIQGEQVRRLLEDKDFDISATRDLVGFAPRNLEEGLREKLLRRGKRVESQ